ncbi:MAG: hypothetical protein ACYS5V_05830, partial [Planctomycetota bacterium]
MTSSPRGPRGAILVLVLVIVGILSVVAVSSLFVMRSHLGAQTAFRRGQQARAAAMSGVHRAMSALTADAHELQDVFDNPALFQAQRVTADEDGQEWYFTVYAESAADPGTHRYGVEDEAGKISLNFAPAEALAALPGMTEEMVDCLLDFRDADSDVRGQGAEQEYYDTLAQPYVINNSPLRTLETLLLVKGFGASVVLGEDANRNGLLEPNEDDSDESFPPDDANGELSVGLRRLATVVTYEPDVDNEGNPRININTPPDERSYQRDLEDAGLGDETVEFLVQAHRNRMIFQDPSHLLGMTVEFETGRSGQKKLFSSGVTAANLAVVMDKLTCGLIPAGDGKSTVVWQGYRLGRVNLSSAPKEVLAALPGLSETAAEQIVDLRGTLDAEELSTTAWIVAHDVVSANEFQKVSMYLT